MVHASDNRIELKPGYWEYAQETDIQGLPLPTPDLAGGECLLESDSNRALEHYVDKFQKGLGVDANCTFSNVVHTGKKASFDLSCVGEFNLRSDSHIQYQHSLTRVDITATGTIVAMGQTFSSKTDAVSVWKRACNEEEIRQAQGAQKPIQKSSSPKLANPIKSNTPKTATVNTKAKAQVSITRLNPNTFQRELKAIQTDKPILIHFTSTDGSCPHCMKNNKVLASAYAEMSQKYHIAEVVFNPWRTYQNRFKRLKGLPVTKVYIDKTEVVSFMGHRENLSKIVTSEHAKVKRIFSSDYSDTKVQKIRADKLNLFVEKSQSGKPLLVHISSTQTSCSACIKNNALFRFGAQKHHSKIDFVELVYDPYSAVKKDAELTAYLKSKKIKISGLPVTLIFKQGKSMGARPGIWPTIDSDLDEIF